jgi:hypothetical protein
MERQDLYLLREGVRLTCLVVAGILVHRASPSPADGISVLCWVGIGTYVFYAFVSVFALAHPRTARPGAAEQAIEPEVIL